MGFWGSKSTALCTGTCTLPTRGGWGCYAHLSGRPFDPIHLSQPGKPGTPARRPSDPTPFLSVKPYNSVNTRKQIAHARTKRPQRTAQNLQQFLIFFLRVCVLCESFARGQLFIWAGSAARRHTQVHTHIQVLRCTWARILFM